MFCEECKHKQNCTEICKPLNNYLKREQAKEGYSHRHIQRKELFFDNTALDAIWVYNALKKMYGKPFAEAYRRKTTNSDDD